jgi:hypothetical protein
MRQNQRYRDSRQSLRLKTRSRSAFQQASDWLSRQNSTAAQRALLYDTAWRIHQ